MSQYQGLSFNEENSDEKESSRPRRLSLKAKDLPVFTIWHNKCGDCCKKSPQKEYDRMQSMLTDSDCEEALVESIKDKQAEEKLMTEQCLDATVDKIVNNLSWVNATLLALAMTNTLKIEFRNVGDKYDKANNAWIYFFIIFIIGIILAVIPRAFEDLTEMKRELNLNCKEKKIIGGDRDAIQEVEKKKQESSAKKIYDFVEIEANELVEKFEDLFVDTLSNTVSIAWRDAAKATFALIITSASATATAYFFYALFMTAFGIYVVIRIGGVYEHKENEIQTYLQEFDDRFNTQSEEKQRLLKFAFVKRSIKLTQTVIKFAIAWSWRDCINTFILAIYGRNNANLVAQQWGYFITIALFVSVAFSFSEQFHILYPKNATPAEQQLFLTDKSRIIVNDVLYDNLRFVVGMALFDALMASLQSLANGEVLIGAQCLLYWIVAIGGISLSVIGTHYVERWGLKKKIADKGVAQAMFDTFERFYDPLQELHIEGDSDFVPMILDTAVFELVYVTVFGLGIAGSMGTTNAIKFTINLITAGSDQMRRANVWLLWVTFIFCLIVSTLITGYFARLIDKAKDVRRVMFKQYRDEDANNVKLHTIKSKDRLIRFSALDDLDLDLDLEQKEEEKEESDQDKQDDNDKTRKRNTFSTKAEDEGHLDDVGGDDDGDGDDGDGDIPI